MTTSLHHVREELAHRKPNRRCCQMSELSALMHMDGTYRISGRGGHALVTESSGIVTARKIYTLLHSLFDLETSVVQVTRSTPRRGKVYRLVVPEQPGFHQVLNELGVLDSSLAPEPSVPRRLTANDCCVGAALRGAFLGGGYISEPFGRADFEVTFSNEESSLCFKQLFYRKSLEPGIRVRRNHFALYLKRRGQISAFLAITGAHRAYLQWESQTILNSTKNRVNRLVNCDSANAKRLAEASLWQRETICRLEDLGILENVKPALRELAEARVENPQASMSELGNLLEPPVSKAVVQSRLRRLASMLPP